MAKAQVNAENGDVEVSEVVKAKKKRVKVDTTDAEILRLDNEGYDLFFDYEHFRELPMKVRDGLSSINLLRYMNELNLRVRALRREAHEKEFGKPSGIEVLGPLGKMGRSERARLSVRGLPESLHPYWALAEEVAERKREGYLTIDDRFPDVIAGDTEEGTRKIMKPDGKDELVLMGVPKERFEAHLDAVSGDSRSGIKSGEEAVEENVKKLSAKVRMTGKIIREKEKIPG